MTDRYLADRSSDGLQRCATTACSRHRPAADGRPDRRAGFPRACGKPRAEPRDAACRPRSISALAGRPWRRDGRARVRRAAAFASAARARTCAGATHVAPSPRAYGNRPSGRRSWPTSAARSSGDASLSASGRLAVRDAATTRPPPSAPTRARPARSPTTIPRTTARARDPVAALRAVRAALHASTYIDDEEGHGVDAGPTGGLTWDGRADRPRDQARIPLLSANEMANTDDASLARKLAAARYAAREFRARSARCRARRVRRPDSRRSSWAALRARGLQAGPGVRPVRQQVRPRGSPARPTLSPAEAARAAALPRIRPRATASTCHPSRAPDAPGAAPMFTDGGPRGDCARRAAPGLPPMAASSAAAASARASAASGAEVDLGPVQMSVGPGLSADPSLCGRFRTPTLRNVAIRPSFFHNGALHSLRERCCCSTRRATPIPARWYPKNPDGSVPPVRRHAARDGRVRRPRGAPFEPLAGRQAAARRPGDRRPRGLPAHPDRRGSRRRCRTRSTCRRESWLPSTPSPGP